MNILNISTYDLKASKQGAPKGQINVNSNIKTENVSATNIGVDESKKTLKIDFSYTTKFNPDVGSIELKGVVLLLVEGEKGDSILKLWENDKKLDKDVAGLVLNAAMKKSAIQSVIISRELDLPTPIPLPTIKVNPESAESKSN